MKLSTGKHQSVLQLSLPSRISKEDLGYGPSYGIMSVMAQVTECNKIKNLYSDETRRLWHGIVGDSPQRKVIYRYEMTTFILL